MTTTSTCDERCHLRTNVKLFYTSSFGAWDIWRTPGWLYVLYVVSYEMAPKVMRATAGVLMPETWAVYPSRWLANVWLCCG